MASSSPSAPITSSRDAADTTAGRIYFSTPSAQVRVPVGDIVYSPPPLMLTLYYLGKNYPAAEKLPRGGAKISGGGLIIPGGRGWTKNFIKKSHSAQHCHTVPKKPYSTSLYIELSYTLSLYIEPNYALSSYLEPNYTLS